jgi:hypothetical protein
MKLKHGHARRGAESPTYVSWRRMVQRCTDRNHADFPRYGARGIKVCQSWLVFTGFLADMGERLPGTTIDRFPNGAGNYEPGNCRWATPRQQQCNTKVNRLISIDGETLTLAEWATRAEMSTQALHHRIVKKGWDPKYAISRPLGRWLRSAN